MLRIHHVRHSIESKQRPEQHEGVDKMSMASMIFETRPRRQIERIVDGLAGRIGDVDEAVVAGDSRWKGTMKRVSCYRKDTNCLVS